MKTIILFFLLAISINAQGKFDVLGILMDSDEPFIPTDQAGLLAWYDFSDITTLTINGTSIDAITDKSGTQGDATPITTSPITKTGQNGLNVCDFAGEGGTFRDAAFTGFTDVSNSFSIYIVSRLILTTGECFIEMSDNATPNRGFLLFVESNAMNLRPDGANGASYAFTSTDYHIFSFIHTPALRTIYEDGVSKDTDANTQNMTAVPTILNIGVLADGSTYALSGEIGEILIYLGEHTEAQRLQIETYLNNKWAIY